MLKCAKPCSMVIYTLLLLIIAGLSLALWRSGRDDVHSLYQVSTGNALIAGLFQGAVDFKTLAKKGGFGLGSVEGMDGELVAIDGTFYRIKDDGSMNIIPPEQTTPYAIVTHFKSSPNDKGLTFKLADVKDLADLTKRIDAKLPTKNIPYAIHIQGLYHTLKLRAVRGATPPYPKFMELVDNQAIFELSGKHGDGVGFFYPAYLGKVNTPGYHIHFITTDRQIGGHILDLSGASFVVSLMPVDNLQIDFPKTKEFRESKDLNTDNSQLMKDAFGAGVRLE